MTLLVVVVIAMLLLKPNDLKELSFAPGFFLARGAAIAAEAAVAECGDVPRVTSAWRSTEKQAELYALYLAGKGNLAAPPGKSKHERGMALDARGTSAWEAAMTRRGWKRPISDVEPWHWEFSS